MFLFHPYLISIYKTNQSLYKTTPTLGLYRRSWGFHICGHGHESLWSGHGFDSLLNGRFL